ncbi:MAG: ATP-binding protein [Chitinispirillales bacterium]|jgi:predicted AAA+ superfamily ATPase|nr:ATP-binding protein [Chitinispirillales bacterium]
MSENWNELRSHIERPEYLDFLTNWKDEDIIKVISGVRRCGKSTLFEIYRQYLVKNGVKSEQIVSINFEEFDFGHLQDGRKLYDYVKSKTQDKQKYYIFLDEIQNVKEFEKVVDSLYLKKNLDIYITGSNAYFLSGELATLLSGRYVELKMLPLSFKEFASTRDEKNGRVLYNEYLKTSFPYAITLNAEKQRQYLDGIYSSVVLKDIVTRLAVADAATLELVIRYLYAETGNIQNISKIANTLTSYGNKVSDKTISRYINGIEDSMLIYKANRYNVKGRKVFANNAKYYAVDNGLRRLIAGDRSEDYGHILENIVYLELLRRGYQVYVGVVDDHEVDFWAKRSNGEQLYIQVAFNTEKKEVLERELRSLEEVKDQHPKLLLTMDEILPEQNFNGIIKTSALKWLLGESRDTLV